MFNTFVLAILCVFVFGAIIMMIGHAKMSDLVGPIMALCLVVVAFVVFSLVRSIPLISIVFFVALYGVALFVVFSRLLIDGGAQWLTRWRGEKWIKEIDYVYLSLGSLGVLAAINRLPEVTGRVEKADILAPLVITTAIVVRFIKTRAEINGWHKLTQPTTSPEPKSS